MTLHDDEKSREGMDALYPVTRAEFNELCDRVTSLEGSREYDREISMGADW